jgi:hypothetical protein
MFCIYLSGFMSFTSQKIVILRGHKNMSNVLNKYMVFPRLWYICVWGRQCCVCILHAKHNSMLKCIICLMCYEYKMLKERSVRYEKGFNLFFGCMLVYVGSCKYMIKQFIHCHLDLISLVSALSILFLIFVCLSQICGR